MKVWMPFSGLAPLCPNKIKGPERVRAFRKTIALTAG